MRKRLVFWVMACFLTIAVVQLLKAQNVGVGTTQPHPSARMEIRDTVRGFLIPRLTTAQRNKIASPAHSLLIFNVDNFCLEVYDSLTKSWLAVSCPAACSPCDTCPLPVVDSLTGPDTVCRGDTVWYTLWGNGGHTYVWNVDSSWKILTYGATIGFIAGNSAVVYGSLCNECGCVYDSIIVHNRAVPAFSIIQVSDSNLCIGDTLVIYAVAQGATSYAWTLPAGWTPAGTLTSDTLRAVATDTGSFIFQVTACNSCGCSSVSSPQVKVWDTLLVPQVAISGPAVVCTDSVVVWKATHVNGASWTWTYPSTWTLVYQAGDSIVLKPDTTDGQITVTVCDTLCACSRDTLTVVANPCNAFCIAIGGSGDELGYSIVQTIDGNYAIAGLTYSFGLGLGDVYIVKLNHAGNVMWTKTIGGTNDDYSASITQTSKGEFVFAAATTSFGTGGWDVYIVTIDSNGNLLWTKTVGGVNWEGARSVVQTLDGGYALGGATNSFGIGGWDAYVVKLDSNGNLQWTRAIGGSGNDYGPCITHTTDGEIVVAGSSNSFGAGSDDVYLIKLDINGNLLWTRTVGGTGNEFAVSIVQTHDKGFVAAGYTNSYGQGGYDVYVIKLDSLGNLEWTRTIGGINDDYGRSVIQTSDSGFAIVGTTLSYGQGNGDVYLIKLDKAGNLQWTRTVGGAAADEGHDIVQASDGGFVIGGRTQSYGQGGWDVYVFKTDANGNLFNCPGGCLVGSGGVVSSGGIAGSGGSVSSGGTTSSGGSTSSGGVLTNICP